VSVAICAHRGDSAPRPTRGRIRPRAWTHRDRHAHRGRPVVARARHPTSRAELGHPWITTFSRPAIMVAVPAFNPLSDELRDMLDPRQRRRAQ